MNRHRINLWKTLALTCLLLLPFLTRAEGADYRYRTHLSSYGLSTTVMNLLPDLTLVNFSGGSSPTIDLSGGSWFGYGQASYLGISSPKVFVGVQPSSGDDDDVAICLGMPFPATWTFSQRWGSTNVPTAVTNLLSAFTHANGGVLVFSTGEQTIEAAALPTAVKTDLEGKLGAGFELELEAGCNLYFKTNLGFIDSLVSMGGLFPSTTFSSVQVLIKGILPNTPGDVKFEVEVDPSSINLGAANPVFKSIQEITYGFEIEDAQPKVSFGLEVVANLPTGAGAMQTASFTGDFEFSAATWTGSLESNAVWSKPFGINNLEISDLKVTITRNPAGLVNFGMGGQIDIGATTITLAGTLPLAGGGLKASVDTLDLRLSSIAEFVFTKLLKQRKGPILPWPTVKIRNFVLSVAEDDVDALDIDKGFVLKGKILVGEEHPLEFADVSFLMNDEDGLIASCSISPLSFGSLPSSVLSFGGTSLSSKVNLSDQFFRFKTSLNLLGAARALTIDLSYTGLMMSGTGTAFAGAFNTNWVVVLPFNVQRLLSDSQMMLNFTRRSGLTDHLKGKFKSWLKNKLEDYWDIDIPDIDDFLDRWFDGKPLCRIDSLSFVGKVGSGITLDGQVTTLKWDHSFTISLSTLAAKNSVAAVGDAIWDAFKDKLWSPIRNWVDDHWTAVWTWITNTWESIF